MPIAVVDLSRTADSRSLVQSISAAPSVEVYANCSNMAEAKDLFGQNKVFAIVEIPPTMPAVSVAASKRRCPSTCR